MALMCLQMIASLLWCPPKDESRAFWTSTIGQLLNTVPNSLKHAENVCSRELVDQSSTAGFVLFEDTPNAYDACPYRPFILLHHSH